MGYGSVSMGIEVLEWVPGVGGRVCEYGEWVLKYWNGSQCMENGSQIMWNGFQSVWIEREADLETKYWPPSDSTVLLIHIPADRVSVGEMK